MLMHLTFQLEIVKMELKFLTLICDLSEYEEIQFVQQ